MSIWTEMQDRGTGDAVKKEDLASEIKSLSNKILDLVTEHNNLVSDISELENRVCYYQGLNLGEIDLNDTSFLKDTVVNSVLASKDYTKMKKYYGNLKYRITKLLYDKESLEMEILKQDEIHQAQMKVLVEKLKEENRKENERMEMERRKEKRIETLYDLMIIPFILFAAATFVTVKGIMLGFAGVTATGIGLSLLGTASVVMICKKISKI